MADQKQLDKYKAVTIPQNNAFLQHLILHAAVGST